jgi:hypothetical protein
MPRPPTAPGIFLQYQQRSSLRQSFVLAAQLPLQLIVFALQLTQGAQVLFGAALTCCTKGIPPSLQLVGVQALLAAPCM